MWLQLPLPSLRIFPSHLNDNYKFGKWHADRGVVKAGGGEACVLVPSVRCWQGSRGWREARLGRSLAQASRQEWGGQDIGQVGSAFQYCTSYALSVLLIELSWGTEGNLLGHLIKLVWL